MERLTREQEKKIIELIESKKGQGQRKGAAYWNAVWEVRPDICKETMYDKEDAFNNDEDAVPFLLRVIEIGKGKA